MDGVEDDDLVALFKHQASDGTHRLCRYCRTQVINSWIQLAPSASPLHSLFLSPWPGLVLWEPEGVP